MLYRWQVFIFRCRYLRLNYRLRLLSTYIVYCNVKASNKILWLFYYNYAVVNFLFKTCSLNKSWSQLNSTFCKPISHSLFVPSLAPVQFTPKYQWAFNHLLFNEQTEKKSNIHYFSCLYYANTNLGSYYFFVLSRMTPPHSLVLSLMFVIWDDLSDLLQIKQREKNPWRNVTFSKFVGFNLKTSL